MTILDFYRQAVDSTEDCGVLFDMDGRMLHANSAYRRLRGIGDGPLGNIFEHMSEDDAEALHRALQAGSASRMGELKLKVGTADGKGVRQVLWRAVEIYAPGRPEGNFIMAQGRTLRPLGLGDDRGMGFTIRPGGEIVEANETMCALCGYTRDEVLAMNAGELYYSPEDRRRITSVLVSEGTIERALVTLRAKDGTPMPFFYTAQAIYDRKGKVQSYSGYFVPMVPSQPAKLESEFSAIVDAMPDIAWVMGRDYRMAYVNDSYLEAFGLSREAVDGKTETEFFPPEVGALLVQAALRVFEERREIVSPVVSHFLGEPAWFRVVRRPIFDDLSGEVVGLLGICRDITAQAQKELEYMRSLAGRDGEVVVVLDAEGRVIRRTEGLLTPTVLGRPGMNELLALDLKEILSIIHPEDLPKVREGMKQVMTLKGTRSLQCRVKNRERRYSTIMVRAHYNEDFFHEPRMYIAVRDASQAALLERADKVIERLKRATGSRTNRELASFLNVSPASVSNAKKQERVPSDWLVAVGRETGASIDWLLTGLGEERREG